jgi:DinB family
MSERECRELTRREALGLFGAGAIARHASDAQPTPGVAAIASVLDRQITTVEDQLMAVAEAMPESKFGFSPEQLGIPGSDYKGVRTFAVQIKHVGASNYALWSSLTGDRFPADFMGGDGPARLRSKVEILGFLRDSFALGHKAAATFDSDNVLKMTTGGKSTRLEIVTFAVSHALDHYGQMVEYLRMNGIVPPASRTQ